MIRSALVTIRKTTEITFKLANLENLSIANFEFKKSKYREFFIEHGSTKGNVMENEANSSKNNCKATVEFTVLPASVRSKFCMHPCLKGSIPAKYEKLTESRNVSDFNEKN